MKNRNFFEYFPSKKERRQTPPRTLFVFAEKSLEEFDDFHDGNDTEAKRKRYAVFGKAYVRKAERIAKERNLANERRQQQGREPCKPERFVLLSDREQALALRTHIEAVEDFCHRHGQERHRRTVTCRVCAVCAQPIIAKEIGQQYQSRYQESLIQDIDR